MVVFERMHAALSIPFWVSSKVFSRVVTPILAGRYGQYSSKTKEILYRIVSLVVTILIAPISISLKGIAELILLFRSKSFTYKQGIGSLSKSTEGLSVLNWNICGLPGSLPTMFGGVAPLSERVDAIADFILQQDCDVVCLQEAHDVNSVHTLYGKLKNYYKHFYLNIGTKPFQHNSGLFVASNKDLSNLSFTPFNFQGKQFGINKGFFCFDVANGEDSLIRIVTTHLQPYQSPKDQTLRVRELQEIAKKEPDIVCGDLNIDRFGEEEGLNKIQEEYVDGLGKMETATDTLIDARRGNPTHEMPSSIDYCLIKKNSYELYTRIAEVYDLNNPEKALSDHHALISTII
jgi:endonuclease/exonuclease/phosphatase family metal-dependent hydrolase